MKRNPCTHHHENQRAQRHERRNPRRHCSYVQHAAIYEALRNRDGRGAQEAMSAHLEYVSNFLRENSRR